MRISIGADHAGYDLKNQIAEYLRRTGHEVLDRGTHSPESCDYPDFAAAVARDVAGGTAERGILVCTTGIGMSIAANKVSGVRAALAGTALEAEMSRRHNDANILTIGARTVREAPERLAEVFLSTPFEGGRHARRTGKIEALERGCCPRPETEGKEE
ncbi:MAG: ribose 5-phosphate isomerase B [Bryobacteraceae bacterium]|nr:ribose 5-phosphate isomerase B [Bryobacteraceae bacterium]